jgi:2-keto-4-pentenoate hydratase/2-oxohepta-3-ene-1,7-dioic acid hydratase in catechol pathway
MIFSVRKIIAFLSGSTTLEAGTLILTGTPEGVGMGRKPPVYLQAGDMVEIRIEGIGQLRNPVIEEPNP